MFVVVLGFVCLFNMCVSVCFLCLLCDRWSCVCFVCLFFAMLVLRVSFVGFVFVCSFVMLCLFVRVCLLSVFCVVSCLCIVVLIVCHDLYCVLC